MVHDEHLKFNFFNAFEFLGEAVPQFEVDNICQFIHYGSK